MHALYTLAWRLALAPAWAWWAWRTRRDGGAAERGRWRERLGFVQVPPEAQDGLLVHAASIGEGVAATALVEALRRERPALKLLLTCTSFTGAERLRKSLGPTLQQVFLPFDTPGAMARLLDRARPRAIVLMETELWPNLLEAARERAIPVVLANARLSARSARGYGRLAALSRPMLTGLHSVLAQSRAIARRFGALGVPAGRIVVTGNLKADVKLPPAALAQARAWRAALGSRPVLVAASTHAGEDEALLAAWPGVRARVPEALLVLVPRHPQRFDAVAQLIGPLGFALRRHSAGESPGREDAVWLGDTLGEVAAWMALADLAFVGGSLVPHGGHSPLEAMVNGCALSSGRHVHNFAEAYRALDRLRGVAWLDSTDPEALAGTLATLLLDTPARQRLGAAGRQVYEAGAGAAVRSSTRLLAMLDAPPAAVTRVDDGRSACWIDTAFAPALPEAAFEAAAWQARGAWQPTPAGRGSAGFIAHGTAGLVLRHFRRGGLMARWLHDSYFGRRPERSRAMREFALLSQLRAAGLDVPRPLAARMQRCGLLRYRADLIVERLPGTRSLAEWLGAGKARAAPPPSMPLAAGLQASHWQAVGAAVRRLHDAGVDHVDLNAHNLLLDKQGRTWVIDFDRCRRRAPGRWREANLQRLARSLNKLAQQDPQLAFDSNRDWAELMAGYRRGAAPGAHRQ
jgi:3-deoxy-D-manno-octulosonic-acid transferase